MVQELWRLCCAITYPLLSFLFTPTNQLGAKIVANKKLGFHIPVKSVTAEKLISAIQFVQTKEIKENVAIIGQQIRTENGLENAINESHYQGDQPVHPSQPDEMRFWGAIRLLQQEYDIWKSEQDSERSVHIHKKVVEAERNADRLKLFMEERDK